MLPLQKAFAAHCVSLPQPVGQLACEPSHRKGAQLGLPVLPAPLGRHLPSGLVLQTSHAPLHAVWQHTPSAQ